MSGGWLAMSWERNENRNVRKLLLYLPLLTSTMITDTAYGSGGILLLGGLRGSCGWYGKSGRGIRLPQKHSI